MKTIRITFPLLALCFFSTFLFSGFKPVDKPGFLTGKQVDVNISLDSIKPGPITIKQLNTVKELIIKSGTATYMAKSYNIMVMPHTGPNHIIPGSGNKILLSTLLYLRNCKPGDQIILVNLKLAGDVEARPLADPKWKIVPESN